MNNNTNLTSRDQNVLEHIFNPDGGFPGAHVPEKTLTEEKPKIVINNELLSKVKALEAEAIESGEDGTEEGLNKCINLLNKCIEMCENYASAYNNRAQAYRMLNKQSESLRDLDLAIEKGLLTMDKNALKQAYTQRGLYKKTKAKTEQEEEDALNDLELGGKYGNELAKKIAVQENPFAKMCSAMVKQMLSNATNGN